MSNPLRTIGESPVQPGNVLALKRNVLHLPRAPRYLGPLLRHGTPLKLFNIARIEAEMRIGRTALRGYPYYFFIDVCNLCNLRCPLCPTGLHTLNRQQGRMSFDDYRRIFDKVKKYALVASVYNLGEPFLNESIFDIIDYTRRNGVGTNLSSNFNWPIPVDPENIVRSGLEYITISLDGVTQETYGQYRVRGDIAEVIENVQALLAARKRLKSRTPVIEWQFIVFRHNEHEVNRAKELALEWGVDHLRFVSPTIPPEMMQQEGIREKWLPNNSLFHEYDPRLAETRGYIEDKACFYLYRSMTIDPNGSVAPCCFAREESHSFGNLLHDSLDDIWNNDYYRSARALFSSRAPQEQRREVLCDICPMYRKCGVS